MKRIAILGSTGSIGRSTLKIVESYPDLFKVVTMAALPVGAVQRVSADG